MFLSRGNFKPNLTLRILPKSHLVSIELKNFFTIFHFKLECLCLTGLYRLVRCWQGKPYLPTNIILGLKRHARDNHPSVLQTFLNNAHKNCYNIGPRGLYYKTLRIRNLWEMDRFYSKLLSSSLDKHISLLRSQYITNPYCFYNTGPCGHCYKAFLTYLRCYQRNLSQSVGN